MDIYLSSIDNTLKELNENLHALVALLNIRTSDLEDRLNELNFIVDKIIEKRK